MLDPSELGPLQQRLVYLDGPGHLTALTIDIAEDHVDLERVGIDACGVTQLFDGQIDLIGD